MGSLRKTGLREEFDLLQQLPATPNNHTPTDGESVPPGNAEHPSTPTSPSYSEVKVPESASASFLEEGTPGQPKVTEEEAQATLSLDGVDITSAVGMSSEDNTDAGGGISAQDLFPDLYPETYLHIIALSTSSSDADESKSDDHTHSDQHNSQSKEVYPVPSTCTPRRKKKHPEPVVVNPKGPPPAQVKVAKDSSTDEEDESNVPLGKRIEAKASKKKKMQNRYKEMKEDKQVLAPIEHPIPSTSAHLRREQARLQKLNTNRKSKSRTRTTTKRPNPKDDLGQGQGDLDLAPVEAKQNKPARPAGRRTKRRAGVPMVPATTETEQSAKEAPAKVDDNLVAAPPIPVQVQGPPVQVKRSVVRTTTVTIVVTDVVTLETITTEEESETCGTETRESVTSSKATIRLTRSKANSLSEPEPAPAPSDSASLESAKNSKPPEPELTTIKPEPIEANSAFTAAAVSGIPITENGEPTDVQPSLTSPHPVCAGTNAPPFTQSAKKCDDTSEPVISPVLQPVTENETSQSICSGTTEDSDDDIIQPVVVLRKVKLPPASGGRGSSPSLVVLEEESEPEKLPKSTAAAAANAKNCTTIRAKSSNNLQPVVRLKRLIMDEPLLLQPCKKKKEDSSVKIVKETVKPAIEPEIRKSIRTRKPRTTFELI